MVSHEISRRNFLKGSIGMGSLLFLPSIIASEPSEEKISLDSLDRVSHTVGGQPVSRPIVFDAYAKADGEGRGNVLHVEYFAVVPSEVSDRVSLTNVLSPLESSLMIAIPADVKLLMGKKTERAKLCRTEGTRVIKSSEEINEQSLAAATEYYAMEKAYTAGMDLLPAFVKQQLENFVKWGDENETQVRVKGMEKKISFDYSIIIVPPMKSASFSGRWRFGHEWEIPFIAYGDKKKVFVAVYVKMADEFKRGSANFAREVDLGLLEKRDASRNFESTAFHANSFNPPAGYKSGIVVTPSAMNANSVNGTSFTVKQVPSPYSGSNDGPSIEKFMKGMDGAANRLDKFIRRR